MRLQSLNHLIDVVRAVARPRRVQILRSASLLPRNPELGTPGRALERMIDADFLLEPSNEAMAESPHSAAGRDSAFLSQNAEGAGSEMIGLESALDIGLTKRPARSILDSR